jgi:hypothetical protein
MGSRDGDEAVTGAADPTVLVAGLRKLAEDTLRAADDAPGDIPALARAFLDQAGPTLKTLDRLQAMPGIAPDVRFAQMARDRVATTVTECVNRYVQGALLRSSMANVSGLLAEAREIAATDAVGDAIDRASQAGGASAGRVCWFDDEKPANPPVSLVQPVYGNVVLDRTFGRMRYTWERTEVVVPRCAGCCAEHERRRRLIRWIAVAIGIVLTASGAAWFVLAAESDQAGAAPGVVLVLIADLLWLALVTPILWRSTGVSGWNRKRLREYPPIADLTRHGWRLGTGPAGRRGRR